MKSRSRSYHRSKSRSRSRGKDRLKLLKIIRSDKPDKKYAAYFSDGTVTHFGAKGYSDFLHHHDTERRERYIKRHKVNEDFNKPKTAGSLSLHILWGPTTSFRENIRIFKKRFNL
jgi:hypothetical protein